MNHLLRPFLWKTNGTWTPFVFSPQRSGSPPNNTFPSLLLPSLPPPPSAYRFNEPVLIAFLPFPFSFSRHPFVNRESIWSGSWWRGFSSPFFSIGSLSQCSERPETRSLVSTAAPPATMRARLFLHAQISPSSMAAMALHYAGGRRTPDLLEGSIDRQDA